MRARQRSIASRDQAASAFGAILLRLCDSLGAEGVALVDRMGETVDYAGHIDPYEIRVTAAECQLLVRIVQLSELDVISATDELIVRALRRSFAAVTLDEGYVIVVLMARRAFTLSALAVSEAVREISIEARLEIPDRYLRFGCWARVEVNCVPGDPRTPQAIWLGGSWRKIEVMGRHIDRDLGRGAVAFRVRLPSGAEINLARELLDRWYAEDALTL